MKFKSWVCVKPTCLNVKSNFRIMENIFYLKILFKLFKGSREAGLYPSCLKMREGDMVLIDHHLTITGPHTDIRAVTLQYMITPKLPIHLKNWWISRKMCTFLACQYSIV